MSKKRNYALWLCLLLAVALAAGISKCAYDRAPDTRMRRGQAHLPEVIALWRENEAYYDQLAAEQGRAQLDGYSEENALFSGVLYCPGDIEAALYELAGQECRTYAEALKEDWHACVIVRMFPAR